MDEDRDETAERSTGLMHIAKAAFPTTNIAPWMTIHTKAEVWILSGMETVADIGEELERRSWLDEQNGKEAKRPPEPKEPASPKSPADKMPEDPPDEAANGKKEEP